MGTPALQDHPGPDPRPREGVLVVDDHPIIRRALKDLVLQDLGLHPVTEAESAEAALGAFEASRHELAIVDISLGGAGGIELVRSLHQLDPDLPILVFSMHDERLFAERALGAGARGYVMKDAGSSVLIDAIRTVLSGEVFLSERMARRVLARVSGARRSSTSSPLAALTDRELEVYLQLGAGLTTREIARRLHLSTKTVETHRSRIKAKLSIHSNAQLLRHAVTWGLGA